jgi:rhodanese-related sulfurtransferase
MGNNYSFKKINFEDMQDFINSKNGIIINTLNEKNQDCLIDGTVSIDDEIKLLNEYMSKNREINIIVYGMNSCDDSVINKYKQLIQLGFYNVYVYSGGLFEWLLLQDIYGEEQFKTTKKELDILRYKGNKIKNLLLLTNQ